MMLELDETGFAGLLDGVAPAGLRLVGDSAIAPPEVLRMLHDLALEIRPQFAPAAWMMVEEGDIVGLCSVTRVPLDGEVDIGYGVAPSRQGRGVASRAIAELLQWARADARVRALTAETGVGNLASQKVLSANGFVQMGERVDPEDGVLICWECPTAACSAPPAHEMR